MPWEKKAHQCRVPIPPLRRGVGSVWRCRRCGLRWTLTRNALDSYMQRTTWTSKETP